MLNTISELTSVAGDDEVPDTTDTQAETPSDNQDIPEQFPDDMTDLGSVDKEIGKEGYAGVDASLALLQSVASYGMTRAMGAYALRTNMISSTALGVIGSRGLETLSEMDLKLAQEGIIDNARQKIMGWLSATGEKIRAVLAKLTERASAIIASIKEILARAGGKVKEQVTTHPYRSIAIALAVLASVGAIIGVCTGTFSIDGTKESIARAYSKVQGAFKSVKSPVGKAEVEVGKTPGKISLKITKIKESVSKGSADALGWTKNSLKSLGTKIDSISTLPGNIARTAWNMIKKEYDVFKTIVKSDKGIMAKAKDGVVAAFGLVKKVKFVISMASLIVAAFRFLVIDTLSYIKNAVSGTSAHGASEKKPEQATA